MKFYDVLQVIVHATDADLTCKVKLWKY